MWPAAVVAVLVGLTWAVWEVSDRGGVTSGSEEASTPMRVAVFPFDVQGDPDAAYLGEATMDLLSEADRRYYVERFKPMDKAGAYAIQEWIGLMRIGRLEGCYANVVGLPMPRLSRALARFGIFPEGLR